jgi:hypothetical protein
MRCSFLLVTLIFCSLLTSSDIAAQSMLLRKFQESKMPERGLVLTAGAGMAAVRSDICGTWECNDIKPVWGIGAIYKFDPYWSASLNVDNIKLGATEKDPAKPLNLSFRSEIIEATASVMVNLVDSYSGSGNYRSLRKRLVVPYAKAGAGIIYYTATSYPGEGNLDESQTTYDPERKYPAVGIVVPFGGGIRFRFSDQLSIAPELMYHITTSDYLDNVGPRLGDGSTKDHFATAALRVMYTPPIKNNIFTRKNQSQ